MLILTLVLVVAEYHLCASQFLYPGQCTPLIGSGIMASSPQGYSYCWELLADPGKIPQVNILDYDENTVECDDTVDYFEFSYQLDGQLTTITDNCMWDSHEITVRAPFRYMLVKFSYVEVPFNVSFTSVDRDCVALTGTGEISTHNENIWLPQYFQKCWIITQSPGSVATFELQTMNIPSNDCLEDWFMAFDGDDQNVSPEDNIGHFCGYNIPPQITSTGNSQMLIFSSQWFSAPAGFSGRYSYAPGTLTTYAALDIVYTTDECTRLTGSGIMTSNPGEENYCWELVADPGKIPQVEFLDYDENTVECDDYDDYFELFYQLDGNPVTITTNCMWDSSDHSIRAPFGYMKVKFSYTDVPFMASFTSVDRDCVNLSGIGEISTYSEPWNVPGYFQKCWIITQDPGTVPKLVFNNVNIPSDDCQEDWVMLFDGNHQDVSLNGFIGHYCGSDIPAPITATSNSIMVVFSSQWFTPDFGFSATYSFVPE